LCEVKGHRSRWRHKKDAEFGRSKIHLDIKNKINHGGQTRPPTAPNGQNIFPTLPKEWEALIVREALGIERGNARNKRKTKEKVRHDLCSKLLDLEARLMIWVESDSWVLISCDWHN